MTTAIHSISRVRLLAFALTCWVAFCGHAMAGTGADLVLINGHVYTADPKSRWAEAVAVKGGKIVYVGSSAGAKAKGGKNTKEIDLGGRLLLPGFINLNANIYMHATNRVWANLGTRDSDSDHTLDHYRQAILDYRARHPDLKQLRGQGFDPWILPAMGQSRKRQPRELLDDIVSDIPAVMLSWSGNQAWSNSKAIEVAGITKDTPNPHVDPEAESEIVHDPKTGEPNGIFYDATSIHIVVNKLPEPDITVEQYRAGVLSWQELARQSGVTGVLVPTDYDASNLYAALQQLGDKGQLTARYTGTQWENPERGAEQVPELVANRAKLHGGRYFKLNAVKIIGPWLPEVLNPTVAALDKQGFQILVHNVGPVQSYATFLDAFEYAQKQNGSRDSRHIIGFVRNHVAPLTPRFNSLGVRVDADWRLTLQPFYDAKVPTTASSDYPNRPLSLLPRIAQGVRTGAPLETLLDSSTIRAAEALFAEKETGSITVGKAADLIVLDKDLFKIAPEEIANDKVLLTLFAGKELYRDPSF